MIWGRPSASRPADFFLYAHGLEPGSAALFALSATGRAATPFADGSGLLCLASPLHRGGLAKVGADPAEPCGGALRADLAALLSSAGGVLAGPGTVLQFQVWVSEPASGGDAIPSDAVELTLQP